MYRKICLRWLVSALLFLRLNVAALWLKLPMLKAVPLRPGMSRRQVIFFVIYSLIFFLGMFIVVFAG